MNGVFKCCGKCQKIWHKREDLVRDTDLVLIGYQPTFGEPAEGLLLFTHLAAHCETTLAVLVGDFEDFVRKPVETDLPIGTLACPGHCLRVHDLQACNVPCQIRWIRQLMQVLLRREVPLTRPAGVIHSRAKTTA